MKKLYTALCIALLTTTSALAQENTAVVTQNGDFAYEVVPQPQEENGIRYVMGGVGDEERARLSAIASEYNLKVLNAASDGDYIGSASFILRDKSNHTLLEVASVDPILYAKLPAGRYTAETTYNGQSKKQSFDIGASKSSKMKTISFYWPAGK